MRATWVAGGPPRGQGMIPLTVPGIRHLLVVEAITIHPPGHAAHWLEWRRRYQARARWCHQRARLARKATLGQIAKGGC